MIALNLEQTMFGFSLIDRQRELPERAVGALRVGI
jgi:hypothetical protein